MYSFFQEKKISILGFFGFLGKARKSKLLKVIKSKDKIAVKGLTNDKIKRQEQAIRMRLLEINIHLL
jgi:hypothetical protein